jgi:hypothetical protein
VLATCNALACLAYTTSNLIALAAFLLLGGFILIILIESSEPLAHLKQSHILTGHLHSHKSPLGFLLSCLLYPLLSCFLVLFWVFAH